MKDIKDYKHSFLCLGSTIEVLINYKDGMWSAEPLTKGLSTGLMTGGPYKTLQEYIANVEQQHRYNQYFHSSGGNRNYAKANMK